MLYKIKWTKMRKIGNSLSGYRLPEGIIFRVQTKYLA